MPKKPDSRPGGSIARKDPGDRLLDRILSTPDLARVVPQLPAPVLHRVIENLGLEDCSELVALATPAQLAHVFDLDLWRPAQPGRDEHFDPARFAVWLSVLAESGADRAAGLLAGMPVEPLIAGFAHYVRVFDYISIVTHETTDGSWYCHRSTDDEFACDIGGYRVMAKRPDDWDAIVEVLTSLSTGHPDGFHQIMSGVRAQSSAGFEVDGLDHLLETEEQAMFDLASDREGRREQQGYATPAQARAFLSASARIDSSELRRDRIDESSADPIARAYFRAIEVAIDGEDAGVPVTDAAADVIEMLVDAGVLPQTPQALLAGSHEPSHDRLVKMRSQMQHVFERDPVTYSTRSAELAFLANTLVAGCSIQSRPFTPAEASEAAIAVCNLGLEKTPDLPDDHLMRQDLVGVFQIGWKTLHDDVAMFAASQLIDTLTRFRTTDRDIQKELNFLRIELTKQWQAGTPWRAGRALEAIGMLDLPACVALAALIDECPVRHAALQARESTARTIEMSQFEWISDGSDLAVVRQFMDVLPETLGLAPIPSIR